MNEAAFLQINKPLWVPGGNILVIWPGVSGCWKILDSGEIDGQTVYLWENIYIEDMGFILSGDLSTGLRMLAEDVYDCTVSEALKYMDAKEILKELEPKGKIEKIIDLSRRSI